MSAPAYCSKCGRDLGDADFREGFCLGCGERLPAPDLDDQYEPDEQTADDDETADPAPAGAPSETLVWELDEDWVVCPRCGAAYELSQHPGVCERCVPDPRHARYAYIYPQDVPRAPEIVLRHEESGEEIRCAGSIVIGRNETPCLAGKMYVGRRHARVSQADGKVYLKDLGSVNGTRVNGRKLAPHEETEIRPGDEIQLDVERFIVS